MKKLRLFLLTWIVSILSVSCFTNADLVVTCNRTCDNVSYVTWYNNRYQCVTFPDNVSSVTLTPSNCSNFDMNYPWGWNSYDTYSCSQTYDVSSMSSLCFYDTYWTFTLSYTYPPILPWWSNWSLTPAINWLHDTVREIIPYVIYIWIWVLLAILWFYWIRRLVNRIAWKINSVFRSKRN